MARLQTSIGCIASLGALASGCFPMEDLSSYSAGSVPSAGNSGVGDSGAGGTSSGGSGPGGTGSSVVPDAGSGSDEPVLDASTVDPDASPILTCEGPDEFAGLVPTTCYRLLNALGSWVDARSSCQVWGGDLVEITSPEENELLAAEVNGSVWIGANDRQNEGEMVWAGGAPVEYATWAPAQPDNFQGGENCVERRAPDGLWNDAPCEGAKGAVCERL